MLRFPYFLHDYKLALLFKRGLIALNVFACPLKLEEKLPGTYLLLVHPDPEVLYGKYFSQTKSSSLNFEFVGYCGNQIRIYVYIPPCVISIN